MDRDERIIKLAHEIGADLTELAYLFSGLDDSATAILCGNLSRSFKNKKLRSTLNLS